MLLSCLHAPADDGLMLTMLMLLLLRLLLLQKVATMVMAAASMRQGRPPAATGPGRCPSLMRGVREGEEVMSLGHGRWPALLSSHPQAARPPTAVSMSDQGLASTSTYA